MPATFFFSVSQIAQKSQKGLKYHINLNLSHGVRSDKRSHRGTEGQVPVSLFHRIMELEIINSWDAKGEHWQFVVHGSWLLLVQG